MSAPLDPFESQVVGKSDGYVGLACPECGWTWTSSEPAPMLGTLAATAVRHHQTAGHISYPPDADLPAIPEQREPPIAIDDWGPSHDR